MSHSCRNPRTTVLLVLAALIAFFIWQNLPSQKVPRLLRELANGPSGNIDLFYTGRQSQEILADLDRIGPASVPVLIDCLDDSSPWIQCLATNQLGRIGDPRAVEPLLARLTTRDALVLRYTISALGDLADSRAVEPLLSFAETSNRPQIQEAAAHSLGQIGDSAAYKSLVRLLNSADRGTRVEAISALSMLGDPRAVPILISLLQTGCDSWLRSTAAQGLGRLGDERARPALQSASENPSWGVQVAATVALDLLSRQAKSSSR